MDSVRIRDESQEQNQSHSSKLYMRLNATFSYSISEYFYYEQILHRTQLKHKFSKFSLVTYVAFK